MAEREEQSNKKPRLQIDMEQFQQEVADEITADLKRKRPQRQEEESR